VLRGIDRFLDLRDLRQHLAVLQPNGAPIDGPRAHDSHVDSGLLLWHPIRAPPMRRGTPEPRISMALPLGFGGRRAGTLDLLKEPARALPR
jgi:hypothetical protein